MYSDPPPPLPRDLLMAATAPSIVMVNGSIKTNWKAIKTTPDIDMNSKNLTPPRSTKNQKRKKGIKVARVIGTCNMEMRSLRCLGGGGYVSAGSPAIVALKKCSACKNEVVIVEQCRLTYFNGFAMH
eukprot:Blabericola_migrator_1__658@NODE_1163_length_5233_cov_27_435927_g793_i0_p5_GENE_NODE_1163_length_5233_cov_27_435927_g793_i0NODE_1163_length_5233_cov_27_435927_g793_i0_p5_ORF_typecomplete_len127_score17_54_NODE_1163_length_5233_cov_27_435927_g793_i030033383